MHANSLLLIQVSSAGGGGKGISWRKKTGGGAFQGFNKWPTAKFLFLKYLHFHIVTRSTLVVIEDQ